MTIKNKTASVGYLTAGVIVNALEAALPIVQDAECAGETVAYGTAKLTQRALELAKGIQAEAFAESIASTAGNPYAGGPPRVERAWACGYAGEAPEGFPEGTAARRAHRDGLRARVFAAANPNEASAEVVSVEGDIEPGEMGALSEPEADEPEADEPDDDRTAGDDWAARERV